ncbi:MAG: TIGR03668 family PPOX class F420-dependent oxidoreductase [Gammaproteobacteria bacterium]|nr:TIGR03668 family PPOX class F420-dependent oxidoreductase [Gammaproteobacteria bacterium]MDE0178946.1 TIGR03668 family PPOX class F420-dependent oxidoreductase [Gammaproteobacteria bacterium]
MPPVTTPPDWALKSSVARLATVDAAKPHVVPVVFCELDGALFIPVDGKPKSGARLQRLRNIERNPAVAVLVDRYSDDWSELCWTRIDGRAEIVVTDDRIRAALRAKYPQYEHIEIGTTAIRVMIVGVVSWSAKGRLPPGVTNPKQ